MAPPKVLIVDDDAGVVFACRRTFAKEGYRMLSASDGREGLVVIQKERPDLVFMDITMPRLDGLSALKEIKDTGLDVPVVIITGVGTMQTAIRAVQLGAYEYITKPLDVEQMRTVARRALEMQRLKSEVCNLQARLNEETEEDVLVGDDLAMQEIYKMIGAVTGTPNETPALILGESGTGKELVARAIHRNGKAADAPFVPINCTALPGELLESELFGYEKGAFTGASERRIGKFEAAENGTIFLDEIGDMPLNLQQKLLRVIQEREFERLGGNARLSIRARFVVATHRDLEAEVEAGRFRKDLYFRISVVPIQIPPLRARKGDLPRLVEHLLKKLSRKLNRRMRGVSPEAMEILNSYDYPGNVRELENILERAIILTSGEVIPPTALPEGLQPSKDRQRNRVPIVSTDWREARELVIRVFEEQFVREALRATGGNVTAAAQRSGLERQSLQRLMQRYEVESGAFRADSSVT